MWKLLLILCLAIQLPLFADTAEGEALERKVWKLLAEQKWTDLEKLIAPYYQAVRFTGVEDKNQFLLRSKSLDISKDYRLRNVVITEGPGIYVITYDVSVTENLEGKRITSDATRLSVWHKEGNNWLWAAHALLIPLPEESTPKASK